MRQHPAAQLVADIYSAFTLREKVMLGLGAVGCYVLWYLLLRSASIPAEPGFFASLLADQRINALLLTALAVPLMTLLASIIVGRVRFEAGLFCALGGLIYLPAHGGPIRSLLLRASGPAVYLQLAIELLILLFVIVVTYLLLGRASGTALLVKPAVATAERETVKDGLFAVFAQAVGTLVLMMLLGQSPEKGQAMAAAGVAALLSTLMIHYSYAVRGSLWYVAGTMLAGIIAYVYTYFRPDGIAIGDVRGFLAGPARSLPLHYATAGAAGALVGYWVSVVWHGSSEVVVETKTDDAAPVSTPVG